MHREGHLGAALFAYAPVGAVTFAVGFDTLALYGCVGVVGLAMLPDVDLRIPGVAHRGLTHTVWFALAVGVVLALAGGLAGRSHGMLAAGGLAVWAFVVGAGTVGSHVFADALTPAGVRPFAPYRDGFYSYELARASNPVVNYALLAGGVLAVVGALGVGQWVRGVPLPLLI